MKSVKIMNTTYIIGDTYKLNGMFFNSGDRVTLRPTVSVNVECKALSVDASGTLLEIVDIIGEDEIASTKIEAEDVEFTTNEEVPIPPVPEEVELITTDSYVEEQPSISTWTDGESIGIKINKKMTKKAIVELINEYDLPIDTNQTKAKILEELEKLDNVGIV